MTRAGNMSQAPTLSFRVNNRGRIQARPNPKIPLNVDAALEPLIFISSWLHLPFFKIASKILKKMTQEALMKTTKIQTLNDLFLEELGDLFNAENQLVKALPKMAKATESQDLRSVIEKH